MRSAPTLKIWITPLASVAMLEKLALLKMARCRAPAFSTASSAGVGRPAARPLPTPPIRAGSAIVSVIEQVYAQSPPAYVCQRTEGPCFAVDWAPEIHPSREEPP